MVGRSVGSGAMVFQYSCFGRRSRRGDDSSCRITTRSVFYSRNLRKLVGEIKIIAAANGRLLHEQLADRHVTVALNL